MANASATGSQRPHLGLVRLHIRAAILWQRSRILRGTHHRYFAWILRIHAFSHSGSHSRNLPHSRTVLFSHRMRATRAIPLALLGNCRNRCTQHSDEKSDWLGIPRRNHAGVPVSHRRPQENLEASSYIGHFGVSRRRCPVARFRCNPKSRATHRSGKGFSVVLLHKRTIHALPQQTHSPRLRQSPPAALLRIASPLGSSLVRILFPSPEGNSSEFPRLEGSLGRTRPLQSPSGYLDCGDRRL